MLGDAVRVYLAGAGPAVLFCVHGGGYCGLTWALVAAALKSECGPSLSSAPRTWQLWEGTGFSRHDRGMLDLPLGVHAGLVVA